MIDYQQLPHQGIQNLVPYKAGKSIEAVAMEQGISDIVKLASNENPLGCSALVLNYFKQIPVKDIALYPDAQQHPLREAIAKKNQISTGQVMLSNGSDALFTLLINLFCLHRKKHLLTHDYAFASYEIQAQTLGVKVKKAAVDDCLALCLDRLSQQCTADTGLIMFANPNNPTGDLIPCERILSFMQSIPSEVIVVVDEAYFEFAFESNAKSALPLLTQFPNLIITRTFSKAYGLAGLRVGYALASKVLIELMWRAQLPFVNSGVSLQAALMALKDQKFVQDTLALNQQGLRQIAMGLTSLGLLYLPSACNFITFKCENNGDRLYDYLLQQGIIVRPLNAYGLPDYIRVSVGKSIDNERFIEAIKHYYNHR